MIFINGRGINPLVTIAAIALIIFIGILLLPIIGGLFLVFLAVIAGLSLYGIYWRWRHGDPFTRMQEEIKAQMKQAERFEEQAERESQEQSRARRRQARHGSGRCCDCRRNLSAFLKLKEIPNVFPKTKALGKAFACRRLLVFDLVGGLNGPRRVCDGTGNADR